MANTISKVYIVGHHGPEHNEIRSIHATHAGALKAWDELRLELLEEGKQGLAHAKEDAKEKVETGRRIDGKPLEPDSIEYYKKIAEEGDEIRRDIVKNLSCEDPEKINNFPHETPYIEEREVVE